MAEQDQNHYQTLGVAEDASVQEISSAFRQLSLKTHPDRAAKNGMSVEQATKVFAEVSAAFDVLKDQNKRDAYDAELANARAYLQNVASQQQQPRPSRPAPKWRKEPHAQKQQMFMVLKSDQPKALLHKILELLFGKRSFGAMAMLQGSHNAKQIKGLLDCRLLQGSDNQQILVLTFKDQASVQNFINELSKMGITVMMGVSESLERGSQLCHDNDTVKGAPVVKNMADLKQQASFADGQNFIMSGPGNRG